MPHPRLRVAVCGGGIGGLVLAVALSQAQDIDIDVYEAAREFAEVGAGVGVWPRPWKILKALGLAQDLAQVTFVPPENELVVALDFRKGDEPHGGTTFGQMLSPGGLISFHRPDFQRIVLQHLARSCRPHTSKRLVSYTQPSSASEPIQLFFQDGTTATCDLLVGADGVKSRVRACMIKEVADDLRARGDSITASKVMQSAAPVWSGMMSYRTTAPSEALQKRYPNHRLLKEPHVFFGKNTQMTAYPIARGTLVNAAAFTVRWDLENTYLDAPWVVDAPRSEFSQEFADWEPEVQALFDCVKSTSRWAVHTVIPLRSFVHRRVILIGDAASAMLPFQGSGAGQAIEDAYILSALLTHPSTTVHSLERAAKIYDAIRRPAAQRVAVLSREAALLYTFNYPGLTLDRDGCREEQLQKIYKRIVNNWAWAWETTAQPDLERAIAMLEGRMQ
ncbi:uncharacterized protein PHACADRAFT_264550 [Phanerochaete carnosa HHB-10118-sp]|uniref:FAD-binding domain-containing protein n=1 Tax=Phanerochaete carnosa (strain HHB-10118-sp) TaxID=650164 RepID=K5WII2_PHACS|nr:uncharacterized protein PHACADRAFT_264550 [Phanerochaete carnosa HHB-10118-sp]EKM50052.1 hypothetical protein PHACADRAFT_264550 [Phanerochaete carnosa HHB-10118-sp]